MAKQTEINPAVVEFSDADLAGFESGGYENKSEAPIVTLSEGQGIKGTFLKRGKYSVNDKKRGTIDLECYTFDCGVAGMVRLGGKVTLDKAMAQVKEGQECIVRHCGVEETLGGNKLPIYKVLAK